MKHLILVRCKAETNDYWSSTAGSHSDWHFATSYYGPSNDNGSKHVYLGGKWEGIFDFFQCYPELLYEYDYIWLPDDDLIIEPEAINTLFSMMVKHDLWLAQPSLLPQSQVYWPITLACPGFELRYTTFVELMAPCFKSSYLRQLLPLFEDRRTGYGLDQYWAYWTDKPARRCAIIDAARMFHPKRKSKSGLYRLPGESYQERDQMIHDLKLNPFPTQIVTGAVTDEGTILIADMVLSRRYFWSALAVLLKAESLLRPGRLLRMIIELMRNCPKRNTAEIKPMQQPVRTN